MPSAHSEWVEMHGYFQMRQKVHRSVLFITVLLKQLRLYDVVTISENPYEFIENFAIDNLGKFSISSLREYGNGINQDYIRNVERMRYSFPSIEIKTPKQFMMEN